jgi:hypothetical protein
MDLITADFETFYSQQYSLSKLTTEEYVRDPQFQAIGLGVKVNSGKSIWIEGPDIPAWVPKFNWDNSMVLAQNTMFDAAIFAWHYGIRPRVWADTLGMSRALFPHEKSHSLAAQVQRMGIQGAKGDEVVRAIGKRFEDFTPTELAAYGEYCCNDGDLTYELFQRYMAMGFPKDELRLIDRTIRMFTEPELYLNKAKLQAHYNAVVQRKSDLMSSLRPLLAQAGELPAAFSEGHEDIKKMLMSNERFASVLRGLGVEPPMKVSPTTGKEAYAFAKTDEAFLELREHDDDAVQVLVEARLGNKTTIEESRTERFMAISTRGKFPVPLRYYGAHSGRWSGCLVADTVVMTYSLQEGVKHKPIVEVLPSDLVWDGEAFVEHEGVKFSGYAEVITWDGVTGTEDHVVFTDAGEISLRDAMQGSHRIETARSPTADDVDAAQALACDHQDADTL